MADDVVPFELRRYEDTMVIRLNPTGKGRKNSGRTDPSEDTVFSKYGLRETQRPILPREFPESLRGFFARSIP